MVAPKNRGFFLCSALSLVLSAYLWQHSNTATICTQMDADDDCFFVRRRLSEQIVGFSSSFLDSERLFEKRLYHSQPKNSRERDLYFKSFFLKNTKHRQQENRSDERCLQICFLFFLFTVHIHTHKLIQLGKKKTQPNFAERTTKRKDTLFYSFIFVYLSYPEVRLQISSDFFFFFFFVIFL